MAYAVVLFLPSVVLNSAAWAQCDAMYTAALLACLYYLLVNRPNRAVLAFSIAFVLKLQAIFFAPFLLLLVLKRKIKLRSLVLIPAVYILSIIPAAIMGRSYGTCSPCMSRSQSSTRAFACPSRICMRFSGMSPPNRWGMRASSSRAARC